MRSTICASDRRICFGFRGMDRFGRAGDSRLIHVPVSLPEVIPKLLFLLTREGFEVDFKVILVDLVGIHDPDNQARDAVDSTVNAQFSTS